MSFIAHSGIGVSDIARSTRFYTELLGFEPCRTLNMTSDQVSDFLELDPPADMEAVYPMMGDFQPELLKFHPGCENHVRARKMNHAGLTHISIGVPSVADVLAKVPGYGGEVVTTLPGNLGAMIRDPDGQLWEILDGAYAAEERLRRG